MTVVKAGPHILLGAFSCTIVHSEYQSDPRRRDSSVPTATWPPSETGSGPAPTPGPAGQCLPGSEKTVALGLGLPGSGDWKSPKRPLHPRSQPRAWTPPEEAGGRQASPWWRGIFS